MGYKTRLKSFRNSLLSLIDKMNVSERVIFGLLAIILVASSLALLKRASDILSIEIPIRGGVLREGVIGYPRSINPLLPVTDSGRDLSTLIYSGLMKISGDGTLVPDLAESYTVSEDGLTYTFILRDKLHFHDNTPVSAFDVEFTVKRVTDPIIKSPLGANWDGVTVKAVDSKTVVFTLRKPYAPFIENATLGILPMHIWKDVGSDAFLFSEFNIEPVGSGPYKVREIKRNSAGLPLYYRLSAFTDYANGAPFINDIYVYFYNNETDLISAYQEGSIDSMSSISPQSAQSIDKVRSNVLQSPLPREYALFLNQNQSKVLADATIRKALRLATPKDEIINKVLLGYGTAIQSPLGNDMSALPPRSFTDSEGITLAKELLAKNGWVVSSTTGALTGKTSSQTLTFSISIPDVPELKQTAELLQSAWQSIGAKINIKIFDSSDLEQNVIVPRQFDTLLFGEAVGRNADLYPFWASSERNYPGQNIAGYANTKADKALTSARSATDLSARKKFYHAFEKEIDSDIPAIFLYSPDLIYVLPNEVRGATITGVTGASERFGTVSKWYIETENVWNFPWIKQ